jgi:hypothetical protein
MKATTKGADMTRIGTYTLDEATTRRTTEQVAAWYTEIAFEPQTVEVFGKLRENGHVDDTSVGFTLYGVVVDAHYPALYGGVRMTSGDRPELHGKPQSLVRTPYAHAIALAMLRGKATGITLDEGVEALYVGYGDPTVDGEGGYTAHIVVNPTQAERDESAGIAAGLAEGCVESGVSAEWKLGWSRAKAALAREYASRARMAADSARNVARDAARMVAA